MHKTISLISLINCAALFVRMKLTRCCPVDCKPGEDMEWSLPKKAKHESHKINNQHNVASFGKICYMINIRHLPGHLLLRHGEAFDGAAGILKLTCKRVRSRFFICLLSTGFTVIPVRAFTCWTDTRVHSQQQQTAIVFNLATKLGAKISDDK